MDVLLIGAGVIGTVYGTQLAQAGHPVDVLDHGQRTRQIQRTGLAITNLATGRHQMQRCSVVSDVSARNYDLVLVSVRADHLASTAAHLRALPGTPTVMFLGNNPAGRQQLPAPIPGSTLLGFPGIGGTLRDDSVGYLRLRRQPTTLETGGGNVVVQFAATLNRAGFPVVRSPDMDGWLAYHAVLVACICAALYRLDGDAAALADDRPALTLMCRSIEEGFSSLAHGGTTGLPHNLHVLHRPLLRPVAVRYWAHTLRSPIGECCFAAHARHAEPEMRALALDVIQRAAAMPDTDHLRALLG